MRSHVRADDSPFPADEARVKVHARATSEVGDQSVIPQEPVKRCADCKAESTPMWRIGWSFNELTEEVSRRLCNACGVRDRRHRAKTSRQDSKGSHWPSQHTQKLEAAPATDMSTELVLDREHRHKGGGADMEYDEGDVVAAANAWHYHTQHTQMTAPAPSPFKIRDIISADLETATRAQRRQQQPTMEEAAMAAAEAEMEHDAYNTLSRWRG